MEEKRSRNFWRSLVIPFYFITILWAVHAVQALLGVDWAYLGLYPRTVFGLRGIFFAPLLHADWGHLISNTPPLFFLSTIIFFFYRRVAIPAFTMIYLLTGLAVWLFGRSVFHIGASGVVYGLVAFVFWNGIFRRNIKSIALALIVIFYYGSMFMGVFPGQEGISWESHLLGALAGIFSSYWFKEKIEKDEKKVSYSWEEEPKTLDEPYFLDRDVFEKTKEERLRERESRDDSWFSNNRSW